MQTGEGWVRVYSLVESIVNATFVAFAKSGPPKDGRVPEPDHGHDAAALYTATFIKFMGTLFVALSVALVFRTVTRLLVEVFSVLLVCAVFVYAMVPGEMTGQYLLVVRQFVTGLYLG
jgi:hypothetical protein